MLLGSLVVRRPAARAAQVVPVGARTTAYSLDSCIAGALGFASAPLTGVLAQRAGYAQDFGGGLPPAAAAAENVRNARALENALLLLVLVTTAAKLLVRPAVRVSVGLGTRVRL